jgi:hypothetical protein
MFIDVCLCSSFCPYGASSPSNCSLYCSVCNNSAPSSCTQCFSGFQLYPPAGCSAKCSLGQYNNSKTGICTDCPIGAYCTLGAQLFTNCSAGSFNLLLNQSTCSLCSAGTFGNLSGAGSNSSCVPCSAGKFSQSAGSSSCTACSPGSFCQAGITTTCPIGVFQISNAFPILVIYCYSFLVD